MPETDPAELSIKLSADVSGFTEPVEAALAGAGYSRYWALWSVTEPPVLLDLIQFDDRPRTEQEVRAGFDEDTAPDQPARLEPISKQRHAELEKTYQKESRRG